MESIAEKAAEDLDETKEELAERWSGSPELVAEDLFRVRSVQSGEVQDLQLFRPYQPQLMNAYFYTDDPMINVYKGRRIGVSFIFCVCVLLDGWANPDTFYPIVSRTKTQAENRIADISSLVKHAKVDIGIEKDNAGELVLENGSNFMAFSGSPDSSRGDDAGKTVFVDEMAFLEDQEETMQAFMPFIALGDRGKMLQVSTPNMANDLFLKNSKDGSPSGENGIIAVKQPTFENPDDINIERSLFEQDVTPVRGDLNLRTVERERAQDPKGFAQEYLCKPIAEEYRFFDSDKIDDALARGNEEVHETGLDFEPRHDSTMVMGVDIGISSDDTAISVFEHSGNLRLLRYTEIVDDQTLSVAGVNPPKRRNPSSIATRIGQIHRALDVDYVILDKTGPGEGFQSEVDSEIGRGAHGFNFRDKEAVAEMMGDFNYDLHKDLINLYSREDGRLEDELKAIVKKKSHEHQKPKFTGKDHSESGKDDLAISLVLAAHPPNIDPSSSKKMHESRQKMGQGAPSRSASGVSHHTGAKTVRNGSGNRQHRSVSNSRKKKSYSRRNPR